MRSFKYPMLLLAVPLALTCQCIAAADENPSARTADAANAVAQAQAAVERARAEHALWTSAEAALLKARRALQQGDAVTAIEQAGVARRHSELGLAQKSYPLFR
jgi:flagellar basal body L-ring protein FlgH